MFALHGARSSFDVRNTVRRALIGVIIGVMGGGLALIIAIGRAALVAGHGRAPAHHVALAPSFLIAFGLGGAVLGALAPLRRTALGAFAVPLVVAAGFMLTIFIGLAGPPVAWSPSTWIAASIAALLLALILAAYLSPEGE